MRASSMVLVAVLVMTGCHPESHYESVCRITGKNVVETDEQGTATQMALQLEWDPCPGEQVQMIRGGREFAACMAKYKIGDLLQVQVSHFWNTRGYYEWDLYEIGGCARPIQLGAPGSYEKSQECHDVVQFGRVLGFECSRRPFKRLVQICPWMSRD